LLVLAACTERSPAAPTITEHTGASAVGASSEVPNEWLLRLRAGADVQVVAVRARRAGATVLVTWTRAIHGFWIRADAGALNAISRDPDVADIEPNTVVRANGSQQCAPYITCSWGLDRIDETNLPMDGRYVYGANAGRGVHAYILDSGIRVTHADFAGRASYG